MRIILTTESALSGARLKDRIIKAVNGTLEDVTIDTWSYIKSGDGFDVIFHNPQQFVEDPHKNVLFRVEIDGSNVVLSTAWWSGREAPVREMLCLHTGRLAEMLLCHFSAYISKFNISDF